MDDVTAKAIGRGIGISTKKAIEVCNFIRGRSSSKAKQLLRNVIDKKMAVPFKRFSEGAGHKPGIGPGKYPVKTCKEILRLVELAEANASNKGLNSESLVIKSIKANQGAKQPKYGRQRGRMQKSTSIEVIVEEVEKKQPKKKETEKKVPEKKEEKKPVEAKQEAPKTEEKKEK